MKPVKMPKYVTEAYLDERFNWLVNQIGNQFTIVLHHIDSQTEVLGESIDRLDKRLVNVEKDVAEIKHTVNIIDGRLENHEKRLVRLETARA